MENCVYCHNRCPLDAPKCDKGRQMAKETAEGAWSPPTEKENAHRKDSHEHHGHHGHHGSHGEGRHHGKHEKAAEC